MNIRRWIALPLCAGALAWPFTGVARAGEPPADTGQDRAAQAAPATAAQEALKDTADFKIVDEFPQVLKKVAPTYPAAARKRGDRGVVHVRALVKKDGTPIEVSVPSGQGISLELDKAAVDAVRQWTFVPAKSKGKPVAVWIVIPVNFRLK
jgi:periplasmic protein TonB